MPFPLSLGLLLKTMGQIWAALPWIQMENIYYKVWTYPLQDNPCLHFTASSLSILSLVKVLKSCSAAWGAPQLYRELKWGKELQMGQRAALGWDYTKFNQGTAVITALCSFVVRASRLPINYCFCSLDGLWFHLPHGELIFPKFQHLQRSWSGCRWDKEVEDDPSSQGSDTVKGTVIFLSWKRWESSIMQQAFPELHRCHINAIPRCTVGANWGNWAGHGSIAGIASLAHRTQLCIGSKSDQGAKARRGFDRGGSRLGREEGQKKRIIELRSLVQQGVGGSAEDKCAVRGSVQGFEGSQ